MATIEKVYKLTSLGVKKASRYTQNVRDVVLDYMYKLPGRQASTTELSAVTGKTYGQVVGTLAQMERSGLVTELTSSRV